MPLADAVNGRGYRIIVGENRAEIQACFDDKVYNVSNWTPDPIDTTTPTLFTEIMFQITASSILFLLLKPLNQPRIVPEILAGIIIGPSLLATYWKFVLQCFPIISAIILENGMSFGIIYYMFQLGLEMNLTPMLRIGKRMTSKSMIGMILPLVVGFFSYFLIIPPLKPNEKVLPKLRSAFVWAITLSSTNMPELTEILADFKLLRTDIGRTAVASSFVTDISTWFFLAILISISSQGHVLRMCLSTLCLVIFFTFLARPMLSWVISKTSKGHEFKDSHVNFILYGVLVSAFITDTLGLGSFLGAFLFGLSLPSGPLTTLIRERIGKVTTWLMVPLYCVVNGTKTNIPMMIPEGRTVNHVILFMVIAWATKIVSAFLTSFRSNNTRPREVFALGVLMNSKGLVALIVINVGRDLHIVDIEASTVMVVTVLMMMMSVPPFIKYAYKPQMHQMGYKIRSIQSTGSKSTFRILTCIHSKRQVQGIKRLLQMSNPTIQSKISAIGVRLVELTEHSSAAMLIVHDTYRTKGMYEPRKETESDPVMEAMEEFGRESKPFISVECLTAISKYPTMHIDVCSIAEDKRAAFLILPFHEQDNFTDKVEAVDHESIRNMNQLVLSNAPCTIGLFVDCGLGISNNGPICVIMFFIGGPDDREALTYAWRMAWKTNVYLTVVRFVPGDTAVEPTPLEDLDESDGILSQLENYSLQREFDDEFMGEFRRKTMETESATRVSYSEKVVNSGDETLAIVKNILEEKNHHLCIVGKGNNRNSPVESGLLELIEFPELGAIGDAVVTSAFSRTASVLVINHYNALHRRDLKTRLGSRSHDF